MPKVNWLSKETAAAFFEDIKVIATILAPFLTVCLIGAYYHAFIWKTIEDNPIINGIIFTSASAGVILILFVMVGAQKDEHAVKRFLSEALQGIDMPSILASSWIKDRVVVHYLGYVARTGGTISSALHQNALENELRELSLAYKHKMEAPQFISGFMVALGLLGTFIGLLVALTGISDMLDGFGGQGGGDTSQQFMQLVTQLKKPLGGMGIAFSASLFGLVTSLMLAIMMINLRRYTGHVVTTARSLIHVLTELSRIGGGGSGGANSLSPEEIAKLGSRASKSEASTLSDGAETMQDIAYKMNDSMTKVAGEVSNVVTKLDGLVAVIYSSVESTKTLTGLLGFGPKMQEISMGMLGEMKNAVVGQDELKAITSKLVTQNTMMRTVLEDVLGATRDVKSAMSGGLEVVASSITDMDLSLKKTGRDTIDKLEHSSQVAISSATHLNEIKLSSAKSSLVADQTPEIKGVMEKQGVLLNSLIEENRRLQERMTAIQKDMRDAIEFIVARMNQNPTSGAAQSDLPPDFIP